MRGDAGPAAPRRRGPRRAPETRRAAAARASRSPALALAFSCAEAAAAAGVAAAEPGLLAEAGPREKERGERETQAFGAFALIHTRSHPRRPGERSPGATALEINNKVQRVRGGGGG